MTALSEAFQKKWTETLQDGLEPNEETKSRSQAEQSSLQCDTQPNRTLTLEW